MADMEDVTSAFEATPEPEATAPQGLTPAPSKARTFVDSAANAVPFGKEAVDAITGGLIDLYKRHLNAGGVHAPGVENADLPTDFHQEYKQARDERAVTDAAGEAAHPEVAGVGKGVGTALGFLAPLPGVKLGGPGGTLATGAVNGALYGGAGGALDPLLEGDYEKAAEQFKEGATVGALLGAPMAVAGRGAQTLGANALRKSALKSAQKALLSGADTLARAKPPSPEALEQALLDKSIPFFGSAETMGARTKARADESGQALGRLRQVLASKGVTGPEPTQLGVDWLDAAAKNRAGEAGPVNPHLQRTLESEAARLDQLKKAPGGALDLLASENKKSGLQDMAQREYNAILGQQTPRGAAAEDVARRLNAANEAAIEAQAAKAPEDVAAFKPAKELYGRRIEAAKAAAKGAQREGARTGAGLLGNVASAEGVAQGDPYAILRGMVFGPIVKTATERLPSAAARTKYGGAGLLRRMSLGTGTSAEALRRLNQGLQPRPGASVAEEGPFDLGDLGQ